MGEKIPGQLLKAVALKWTKVYGKIPKMTNLVNFTVIGIFINKNTYTIPTDAFVTYCSVKDTENLSRHFFCH